MQATTTVQQLLFEHWNTKPGASYFGAVVVAMSLAGLDEGLSALSVRMNARSGPGPVSVVTRLLRAATHTFHFAVAYLAMLMVMSYNVGLFLAVVFGAGLVFFASSLLGWRGSVALGANCGTTEEDAGLLEHGSVNFEGPVLSVTLAISGAVTPAQLDEAERRLLSMRGIHLATVSKSTRRCNIGYFGGVTTLDTIVGSLRECGFNTTVVS